jgi:hypothetical protein
MERTIQELKESQRGREFAAEWEEINDPIAGKRVVRFTSSLATDQHPYFTGPAVTDAGRLIIISERTGNPNLFAIDMRTGKMVQLTDNRWGTLRQYVSPWGNRVGFGKYSVSVCARTGNIYYLQGSEIRRVNSATADEFCVGEIPEGFVTAFTHVSTDDRWLCVPVVHESAFAGSETSQLCHGIVPKPEAADGFRSVVKNIKERGLESRLWVVATDGTSDRVWATQRSWITHVQFRPNDNRYIVFNNEGIGETAGEQRIWMCEQTGKIWKIRPEPRDKPHWNCHELWTLDGSELLYHGSQWFGENKRTFLGFSDLGGENYREFFARPADERQGYGHFGIHARRDHAYCDGYFDMSLITEVSIGADNCLNYKPLCRHDTRWLNQDDHPHPILSADGATLIFSSSRRGVSDVYGLRL